LIFEYRKKQQGEVAAHIVDKKASQAAAQKAGSSPTESGKEADSVPQSAEPQQTG